MVLLDLADAAGDTVARQDESERCPLSFLAASLDPEPSSASSSVTSSAAASGVASQMRRNHRFTGPGYSHRASLLVP
jgi:hypothetical protein